jgi:hypothetical protein
MVLQGLERDVPIDLELMNHLRTLDDLVYEVQLAGADITALEQLSNLEQETHLSIHLLKPESFLRRTFSLACGVSLNGFWP